MPIFWTMLGCTGAGALFWGHVDRRGIKGIRRGYNQTKTLILLTFTSLIFFASMRSYVSDTAAYMRLYQSIPTSLAELPSYIQTQTKDRLFWGAAMIFKCIISANYHVWFFCITMICCILIACTFARYSEMPFLSAFMFILTCNFTWLFNGMRQFMAACILFYAVRYIAEKRFAKYLVLCLLASAAHITALIGIPVYFIVSGKAGNKKVVISMLAMLAVIWGLPYLLPAVDDLLSGSSYEMVISQFSEDDGVNIVRFFISAVPVVMFFMFRRNVVEEIPAYINVAVNMCIFTVLMNLLGHFTSGIYIGRMTIYFEMTALYLYPWIFQMAFDGKDRKIVMTMYVLFYFAFYYYQMVITWEGFGYVSDVLNIRFR